MRSLNPISHLKSKLSNGRLKNQSAQTKAHRSISIQPASSYLPSDPRVQKQAEKLLEEFVNIDSVSNDAEGVDLVQNGVARELSAMGFTVSFQTNKEAKSGRLIVAEIEGERKNQYVTFVTHADVVLGLEVVGPYRKSEDGLRARGPGVIDNKGGLVVALQGLQLYLTALRTQGKAPKYSLRFVSSPNEEAGSPGFQKEFAKYAKDSRLVLGFEPALDNGSIIESRRGNRWYQIKIAGQEAHAGRCKGEEINAAHDAALKIAKLHKLAKGYAKKRSGKKSGVSLQIAQLQGGRDRFNVVCGEVNMKLDTRFASFQARDKLHKQIEAVLLKPAIVSKLTGAESQTSYEIADDCPPFSASSKSRAMVKIYVKTVKQLEGRKIISEKAGGAGDVNYMSSETGVVLDGLGPVGGQMHTTEEYIYLPSLSTRASALCAFLMKLS